MYGTAYSTRERKLPRRRDAHVATVAAVAAVRITGYGLIWMGLLLSVAAIATTLGRLLPPL